MAIKYKLRRNTTSRKFPILICWSMTLQSIGYQRPALWLVATRLVLFIRGREIKFLNCVAFAIVNVTVSNMVTGRWQGHDESCSRYKIWNLTICCNVTTPRPASHWIVKYRPRIRDQAKNNSCVNPSFTGKHHKTVFLSQYTYDDHTIQNLWCLHYL